MSHFGPFCSYFAMRKEALSSNFTDFSIRSNRVTESVFKNLRDHPNSSSVQE